MFSDATPLELPAAWRAAVAARIPDGARLAALRGTDLLDSPEEEAFDRFTRLASRLTRSPAAAVSLIDDHRQFFKSAFGFPAWLLQARGTSLSYSFCQYVVALGEPLSVADARTHEVLRDNSAVAEGVVSYLGVPLVLPDGSVIGALCVIDGKPRAWEEADVASMQDIAKMAMAEIALRDSEAQFRQLAEAMPQMVFVARPDGADLYHTAQWSDYTGLPHDAGALEPVHPDDLPRTVDARRQAIENKTVQSVEVRLRRADGVYRWWLGRAAPQLTREGEILKWFGTWTDIHDLKMAELSLQRKQNELRVLFDFLPAMICFKDTENNILRINQRVADLVGKPIAEIEGRPCADSFPGDAARLYADDLEVIHSGAPKLGVIEAVQDHENKEVWLQTDKVPFRDEEGNVSGVIILAQDLTERRTAQEAIRESEERYSSAFDNAPIGMAHLSLDCRWLKVNRALCEMLGYSEAELLTLTCFAISHPEDVEPCRQSVRQLLAGEIPFCQSEKRYLHARGNEVAVAFHLSLIRDRQGEPRGLNVQVRDITEQRKAERELRFNEQRYRSLVEAISAIVWDMPASGRFESPQASWADFTGQTFREHRGWGWIKAIHPDDQTKTARAWSAAVAGQSVFQLEHRLLSREGVYRDMMVRAVPILTAGGAIAQWIGVHSDITERNREEEELRWKTAFLEAQANSAPDGMLVLATDGRRLQMNRRYIELLKIPQPIAEDEDRGPLLDWVANSAKDPAQFRARVKEIKARPQESTNEEIEFKNGTVVARHTAPVIGKDGKNYGRLCLYRDVTEQKRDQARVIELNRQLVDLSRQAGMAEIATGVLHNVGNVLNSANVSLEIAAAAVSDLGLANLGRVVEVLHAHEHDLPSFLTEHPQGRHLVAYLDELAKFSRQGQAAALAECKSLRTHIGHISEIVGRQQSFANGVGLIETLSINELVDDALCMNGPLPTGADFAVRRELDPAIALLPLDRHKIMQILLNLIRNAGHALSEGDAENRLLTVRTRLENGPRLQVVVEDNGVGISAQDLPHIFEYGFTTRKAGRGFGLHSCAVAAQEMDGSLHGASAGPGQGAVFTLELPAGSADPT